MATVTHYIRSDYDPEVDKERLLRETGQTVDESIWQTESPSAAGFHKSNRLTNFPKFVPAVQQYYGEWDAASTSTQPTTTATATDSTDDDVASWYRFLNRQGGYLGASSTKPTPTSRVSPGDEATSTVVSTGLASATPSQLSSPSRLLPRQDRGRDWFISRAISQFASAPATFRPSQTSLADILSRNPPTSQPFRPPVFLHLGPSNKGWAMLQNQGWSEGEGLGSGSRRGNDAPPRTPSQMTRKKKARLDSFPSPSPSTLPSPVLTPTLPLPPSQERTAEVLLDDDIVEVRKTPMIDLTLSDTEDEEEGEDDSEIPSLPDPTVPVSPSGDRHATQTALLTPLPTVLKSDRLGIGLKAKTEGPYRSSVKRVTHNAAALAAHAKANENMRHTQQRFGKGRRPSRVWTTERGKPV
ncbi:hypothetical protein B0F90DRAFT_1704156 [Multifurca ochricompacta]|uniref:G-patch domain-containing protein n=1 Tax=Multifurca ochricompacta TaxID=376703 RepID=A0AAD4M879_9AGAM|nr:hypothetical protein B0F90DRAFT_1704156 [Multifurca ochricompacta]